MLRRLKKDALDLPEIPLNRICRDEQASKVYNEGKQEIKEQIDKIKVSNNPLAQLIQTQTSYGIYRNIKQSNQRVQSLTDLRRLWKNWLRMVRRQSSLVTGPI